MLINGTIEKLRQLKLFGMVAELESQMTNVNASTLAFEDRIGLLVDQEVIYRENKRLKYLLSSAKLRENACVENIDYRTSRGLDKAFISSLSRGYWIDNHSNLIITGLTGSGKTWLACALGNQACRQGRTTLFTRVPNLLDDLAISHGDVLFYKKISKLASFDLLILDDFGISDLKSSSRSHFLELVEARTGRGSIIVTSQLPVDKWHDYLSGGKNPTIADSILDRLVNNSHRISLGGESMRKIKTLS